MEQFDDISQTLFEIYTRNMNYLQNTHSKLYESIKRFETFDIENYYIDFVDSHFELCKSDGTKLYNCDPFYDGQYRATHLNDDNIFTLIQESYPTKKVHYGDSLNAYADINQFIDTYNSSKLNQSINKFIFVGTLLGVHINDIDRVLKARSYLIIEPNIEIFRLSLFMCDYETLAKQAKLFFCIAYDHIGLKSSIKSFLDFEYKYNTKIQFELGSIDYIVMLEEISVEIAQNSQMTYPYSEYIVSMKRGYECFTKGKNGILNIDNLKNIFVNKSVLFLGAGASVSSYLEWIYLYQDRFIIVCVSAILKRLELLGIIPDIILVIDGQKDAVLRQFEVDSKMYRNSIVLASIKIDRELFDTIESKKTFYIQDSFELFEGCGILTGVTVGDIGIGLLLKFGVQNLYLLGFDACISPINCKTHDSLHRSSRKIDVTKIGNSYDTKLMKVKGNFRDEVDTFIFYTGMIDNIKNICATNTRSKIYNLSDGAYFNHTEPMRIEDINLRSLEILTKDKLQENLLDILWKECKKELVQKDIAYLKKEKKILQKLQGIKQELLEIELNKLQNHYPNSAFLQILKKYFKLIAPYAYYTQREDLLEQQCKAILAKFEEILALVME